MTFSFELTYQPFYVIYLTQIEILASKEMHSNWLKKVTGFAASNQSAFSEYSSYATLKFADDFNSSSGSHKQILLKSKLLYSELKHYYYWKLHKSHDEFEPELFSKYGPNAASFWPFNNTTTSRVQNVTINVLGIRTWDCKPDESSDL